jgi:hypothetical protein
MTPQCTRITMLLPKRSPQPNMNYPPSLDTPIITTSGGTHTPFPGYHAVSVHGYSQSTAATRHQTPEYTASAQEATYPPNHQHQINPMNTHRDSPIRITPIVVPQIINIHNQPILIPVQHPLNGVSVVIIMPRRLPTHQPDPPLTRP